MREKRRARARLYWLTLFFLPLACVPGRGGWDESLLPPGPDGRGPDRGRLADGLPQILPDSDGLLLFLCRWPKAEPIPVHLSAHAQPRERRLWQKALRAWESAGLGISFVSEEMPLSHGIEVAFPTGAQRRPEGTGDALADCQIRDLAPGEDRVEAHLHWASIHLNRSLTSWKLRETPLDEDELLGAMLHELGHALGFSGHARSGHSIMVADKARVRKIAREVGEGGALPAPELVALYRLPSGVRVGRLPLSSTETQSLQQLEARSGKAGLRGPYSRVGDRQAEFFYRGERGERTGVRVENYLSALGGKAVPVIRSLP